MAPEVKSNHASGPLVRIVRSPRFWRGTPAKVVLLLLIANFLVAARKAALERAQKENLLVAPVVAQAGRRREPRFDESVGNELWRYWAAIPDATLQPLVVLSGMSQMYAINDPQPGDQIIAEWMDDRLAPSGVRVFGLAAPNLDNEEALFLLLSVASDPHKRPQSFIYGLCFDKFRNVDLRGGYQEFLRRHPEIEVSWRQMAERYAQIYPLASAKMLSTLAAVHQTSQQSETSAEGRLRDAVGRFIPLVGERRELNAQAQMQLYDLRNRLLGITSATKRPIIESRYELNRQFLQLIALAAREHGIQPVFYVIPLNPSAETPYVREQYEAFKRWVADLTEREHIPFADFEGIIPREDWGFINGEPDYKHFRGVGHRITADSIIARFGALFARPVTIARADGAP